MATTATTATEREVKEDELSSAPKRAANLLTAPSEAVNRIAAALNLPKNTVAFTLRVRAGRVATLEVESLAEASGAEDLASVLKRYRLEELSDERHGSEHSERPAGADGSKEPFFAVEDPNQTWLPGGIPLTLTERCELYDWRDECVAEAVRRAVEVERDRMRALISDDASAVTYQSRGQYRTALLRALRTNPTPTQPQTAHG